MNNEEILKRCSRCREHKPMNELHFHKHRNKRDGYDNQCKECKKAYDKKRYIQKLNNKL